MAIDQAHLGELVGSAPVRVERVRGGDVAESFRVDLADGRVVFAKTHANPPPHFFSTEAAGLDWLRDAGAVAVARVLGVSDDPALLVLEWIDEDPGAPSDEDRFGRDLAALHRAGAPAFGRQDRRTTGSRGLPNEPCPTWAEFYATQRLLPLARLAADARALDPRSIEGIESIAGRLDSLGGPSEPPARLHGDLWAGNRIVDGNGTSWLIDPACHGGHREFDLAMMRLFGGFGAAAFTGYAEVFPLAEGWQHRVLLHQLAPLVVHAIKFGGHYVATSADAISHYR